MSQEIVVDFYRNGTVKVETFGFQGATCKDATGFLNALGKITEEENKPEYWADSAEVVYAR